MIRNAGLGEFLRSRRARLDPAQAGLTSAAGRRVPGLPREELTRLARCASPGLRQGIYGQDSAIRASTGNAHMIIGASRLLGHAHGGDRSRLAVGVICPRQTTAPCRCARGPMRRTPGLWHLLPMNASFPLAIPDHLSPKQTRSAS